MAWATVAIDSIGRLTTRCSQLDASRAAMRPMIITAPSTSGRRARGPHVVLRAQVDSAQDFAALDHGLHDQHALAVDVQTVAARQCEARRRRRGLSARMYCAKGCRRPNTAPRREWIARLQRIRLRCARGH